MKTPKYFYRVTEAGEPIPGTLARLDKKPITGKWKEIKSVCCTEECGPVPEEPTAGYEITLNHFNNGYTEALEIVGIDDNVFSQPAPNQIILKAGKESAVIQFLLPATNSQDPDTIISMDEWNMGFIDYVDNEDGTWTVTAVVGTQYNLTMNLPAFVRVRCMLGEDVYVGIWNRYVFLNSFTESTEVVNDHSAATLRFYFPNGAPVGTYDIQFWWRDAIVDQEVAVSGQTYTMNSNTITGLAFDRIVIVPTPEP